MKRSKITAHDHRLWERTRAVYRSRHDKRKRVALSLLDDKKSLLKNELIAEYDGVHPRLVRAMRKLSWDQLIEEASRPRPAEQIESSMADWACGVLSRRGAKFKRQARCAAGVADLVFEGNVVEFKHLDSRRNRVFEAYGQVLTYAHHIGGEPCVVFNQYIGNSLYMPAKKLGIWVGYPPRHMMRGNLSGARR